MFRLELFLFASILIQLLIVIGLNPKHNPLLDKRNASRLPAIQISYKKTK
jgi:hypothetical protein